MLCIFPYSLLFYISKIIKGNNNQSLNNRTAFLLFYIVPTLPHLIFMIGNATSPINPPTNLLLILSRFVHNSNFLKIITPLKPLEAAAGGCAGRLP